jgi:serine phosphatase RsbU (regulator of sigma subunit)
LTHFGYNTVNFVSLTLSQVCRAQLESGDATVTKVKVSISFKLILVTTLLLMTIAALSGVLGSVQTNRVIDDLGGRLNTKILESLRAGGVAQVELLIQLVRLEMLQHDYTTLQTIVDGIAENDKDITAIGVTDRVGIVLAHTDRHKVGSRATGPLREGMKATNLQIEDEVIVDKQKSIAFTSPVEHSGDRLGSILVAYTLTPLKAELDSVQLLKKREGKTNIRNTLIFAIISAAVGLVLAVIQGFRLARPIRSLVAHANKIADGELESRVEIDTQDEIGLLGERFNYMAGQVQMLMRASVEKAAMEKEIEVASAVQATLIPDASSAVDLHGLSLASHFKPATKVGGDWWTYYHLPDDKILLLIGDVTGHGVGSAMITAAAKGAASCLMAMTKGRIQLQQMFEMLNAAIIDTARGRFVMSCCAAVFDPRSRTMLVANAGHNFPFHFRRKTGKLVSMVVRGNKLGDLHDSEFETKRFPMEPGDMVYWYTDGVIECIDERGEEYGERRFRSLLRGKGSIAPDRVRDDVVESVRQFHGSVPPQDDITIIAGRVT